MVKAIDLEKDKCSICGCTIFVVTLRMSNKIWIKTGIHLGSRWKPPPTPKTKDYIR